MHEESGGEYQYRMSRLAAALCTTGGIAAFSGLVYGIYWVLTNYHKEVAVAVIACAVLFFAAYIWYSLYKIFRG